VQRDGSVYSTVPSFEHTQPIQTQIFFFYIYCYLFISLIGSLSPGKEREERAGEEREVLYAKTTFQEKSISLEIFFFTLFGLIVSVRHQQADSIYIEHLCLLLFFSPHIHVFTL